MSVEQILSGIYLDRGVCNNDDWITGGYCDLELKGGC